MGSRARFFPLAATLFTLAREAHADCDPRPGASTCITSDALWPIPGPQRFAYVPSTELPQPGRFSLALVTTFQKKPIDLHVATPGPSGTDATAVDEQLDTTLATSFGIVDRVAAFVATPATLHETGGGASSATGRRLSARSGLRDPRLGVGVNLMKGLTGYLEAQIPTHSTPDFGGEEGVVVAPTIAGDFRRGRLDLAASLGARIRTLPQTFFGETQGTQALLGVGASGDIAPHLAMGVEAHGLVGFGAREEVSQNRFGLGTTNAKPVLGGEWLGFFRGSFFDDVFSVLGGAGGTMPLGGLIGIGRIRFVVGLAYTPGANAKATEPANQPPGATEARPSAAGPPATPAKRSCVTTCSPADDGLAARMDPVLEDLHQCLARVGAANIHPVVIVTNGNSRLDLGGYEELECAKNAHVPTSPNLTTRCELRCAEQ